MISQNQLKQISFLKQKKCRLREGKFIVEGLRLCEELVRSDFYVEQILYCSSTLASTRGKRLLETCRKHNITSAEIDAGSFKKISSTVNAQGIAAITRTREMDPWRFIRPAGNRTLIALWNVKDPGNLGTIIRSAAWFGIDAVLTSTECAEATNPKTARATMGALFYLPVFEGLNFSEALPALTTMGYHIRHAEVGGEICIKDASFSERNVILLGGETNPLPRHLAEWVAATVRIPRFGYGDSLNVAAAAAILMAELKMRSPRH